MLRLLRHTKWQSCTYVRNRVAQVTPSIQQACKGIVVHEGASDNQPEWVSWGYEEVKIGATTNIVGDAMSKVSFKVSSLFNSFAIKQACHFD